MTHKRVHPFISVVLLSLLFGCYQPISKGFRQESAKVAFSTVEKDPDAYIGDVVIWGGAIIKTVNLQKGTEIFVLQMPLRNEERPKERKKSAGRFIIRNEKFLDPAIYRQGRKITAAGKLTGKEALPIGEENYTYPVIQAMQLHLWLPEYPPYAYSEWDWGFYPSGPYMWPYGGGVGGGWEESNQDLFEEPGDID